MMWRWKGWGRLGLAVVAPVLMVAALEAGLALFTRLEPLRLLRQEELSGRRFWVTNPRHGEVWFARHSAPMPSPVWIPVEKTPGVKRVLLLGESAAAGFPMEDFNLARLVEAAWALQYPGARIEVVNLTMTGINSHALRRFLREAMAMEPDALVLYAGHNEAIGPFGPADRFGRRPVSPWFVRALIALRVSRTGQLLGQISEVLVSRGWWSTQPAWSGLDAFNQRPLAWDDPALDAMARSFSANVNDMLTTAARRELPVLVVQPAVNLRDWPPLDSEPETMDDPAALRLIETGRLMELRSAWQIYRLAREIERKQGWVAALPIYRHACELDRYRFRADTRIRNMLQRSVLEQKSARVRIVDGDMAIRNGLPPIETDRTLFLEHVHLTFAGLSRMAGVIAENLADLLGQPNASATSMSLEALADRVWFTEVDEYLAWRRTAEFMDFRVFASQPLVDQRKAEVGDWLTNRLVRLRETWSPERLERAYQEVAARPDPDPVWHKTAGRLFLFFNQTARARGALETYRRLRPADLDAWLNLAHLYAGDGQYGQALDMLMDMKLLVPVLAKADDLHGELLVRMGRLDEAAGLVEDRLRRDPRDAVSMVNLASLYQQQGRNRDAMVWYNRYLAVQQDDADAMNNLAWLLATGETVSSEEASQAVAWATKALTIKTNAHRIKGTLAVAYARAGDTTEAARWAAAARSGARQAGDEAAITALDAALGDRNLPTTPNETP